LKTENIKRIYNKHLTIVTQNGKKETTEGRMWFDSPFRKSATDVGFEPADPINTKKYYNLWQGFAYTAWDGLRNGKQKADCNLFKNMVRDVIANKNKEVYEYVMNWLAYMFQNVGKRRPELRYHFSAGSVLEKDFSRTPSANYWEFIISQFSKESQLQANSIG
jgi:alpha-L-fucosidase